MGTRHTKERLLEVMGKVNPEFKLVNEISVLDNNINQLVEADGEQDETEQEQIVSPEEEQKAAEMDQEAENATASEEDLDKPVVAQNEKGVNIKVTVPTYKKKLFEKHLKSIYKLAKRMGSPEPTINIGEVYSVQVKKPTDTIPPHQWYGIDVFDVEILVDGMFKLPGNYKLVAVVDNSTGGSIEIDETEPVPPEHLQTLGQCDLCKQERYRGKNFIVKDGDSGEYMCLGSSCVKKYIGVDPSKYIRTLSYLRDFREVVGGMFDEDDMFGGEGGGGRRGGISEKNLIVDAPKVISLMHSLIESEGKYVKREWEQIERGWNYWETVRTNSGEATADKVEKIITNPEEFDNVPVDDAYVKSFMDFVNTLEPIEPKMVDDPYGGGQVDKNAGFNEYRSKVRAFGDPNRNLRVFETAFLGSAINYFENEKAKIAKAQELAGSTWLGNVGEKIPVPYARLDGARTGEGAYGTWFLWELVDENGNALKKFGKIGDKFKIEDGTGEELFGFNKGDVFAFTAEVKKHDEYNGLKSTMLGRLSKLK